MIVQDLLADETPKLVQEGRRMVCKKLWFATEQRALGYRNRVRNILGKDQRQYYCKKCLGWHLTSRLMPWQINNAKSMGYTA